MAELPPCVAARVHALLNREERGSAQLRQTVLSLRKASNHELGSVPSWDAFCSVPASILGAVGMREGRGQQQGVPLFGPQTLIFGEAVRVLRGCALVYVLAAWPAGKAPTESPAFTSQPLRSDGGVFAVLHGSRAQSGAQGSALLGSDVGGVRLPEWLVEKARFMSVVTSASSSPGERYSEGGRIALTLSSLEYESETHQPPFPSAPLRTIVPTPEPEPERSTQVRVGGGACLAWPSRWCGRGEHAALLLVLSCVRELATALAACTGGAAFTTGSRCT